MNIRLISAFTTLALVAGVGLCEAKSGGKTTPASKTGSAVSTADKHTMVSIAKGNMAELKLSEYVQNATTNPAVKSFAQKMLDGHTQMGNELSTLASGKGVSLPSAPDAPTQAALNRLKGLSGAALDKAYMTDMVNGHKKVLGLARTLASHTHVPDIKTFADGGITAVTNHLNMALDLQKSLTATATKAGTSAH